MFRKLGLAVLAFVVMVGLPSQGLAASVTLTPSVASPQKLGVKLQALVAPSRHGRNMS